MVYSNISVSDVTSPGDWLISADTVIVTGCVHVHLFIILFQAYRQFSALFSRRPPASQHFLVLLSTFDVSEDHCKIKMARFVQISGQNYPVFCKNSLTLLSPSWSIQSEISRYFTNFLIRWPYRGIWMTFHDGRYRYPASWSRVPPIFRIGLRLEREGLLAKKRKPPKLLPVSTEGNSLNLCYGPAATKCSTSNGRDI